MYGEGVQQAGAVQESVPKPLSLPIPLEKGDSQVSELAKLYQTSAHHLPMIADKSVRLGVTSPPYFGLRVYDGAQRVYWETMSYIPMVGLPEITVKGLDPACPHRFWKDVQIEDDASPVFDVEACIYCGGTSVALGNEPTIEAFIGHLILCAREWRRILKDDGIMFVNLGDSYSGSGKGPTGHNGIGNQEKRQGFDSPKVVNYGLPPKNLMMVPQHFALAMQADGWIVRSEIIWAKGVSFCESYSGSVMPESVQDRPVRSHEQIYMFTKSPKYYYNLDAVREPLAESTIGRYERGYNGNEDRGYVNGPQNHMSKFMSNEEAKQASIEKGRNIRDTWAISPKGYAGAHFAAFPEKLIEPMIKAGSREGDTVFDPFSGSGTTGRVAIRLGRKYIGTDLSEKYLTELSPERLKVQQEMNL